jgi:transcriptional regulator with XRE-family HTH domain
MARRAGTSQPVISAYEHGQREPTLPTLRRLVAACDVDLLVGWTPLHGDLPAALDVAEHARRLLDVLSLADAIPTRRRPAELDMPRLVSK